MKTIAQRGTHALIYSRQCYKELPTFAFLNVLQRSHKAKHRELV